MSSFEPLPGWGRRTGFSAGATPPTSFQPDGSGAAAERPSPAAAPVEPAGSPGLEERLRRAYEEGLAAGRREALEAEHERAFATLEDAARAILQLRDGYLAANRREVVELALAVAGARVGRPHGESADVLAERLAPAFESLPSGGPVSLRLAPADHERVAGEGASELARRLEGRAVALQADPDLAPGEFRLEAGSAEMDGRRDALLAELRERLIEAVGGETE